MTCWCGAQSTSALSAMKWTPQKMMKSASGLEAICRDSLNESPTKSAKRITSSRW